MFVAKQRHYPKMASSFADSDFRGTIKAVVESQDKKTLNLVEGQAWFQLVPVLIHQGDLERVDAFDDSSTRTVGFGSTGGTDGSVQHEQMEAEGASQAHEAVGE
jgi:hypothetical protein